ncbi:MAG TPA: 4-coumarate--CoA ligase family protein [bacterium]|nr:4-coumarate--CoA ligase family protein [bacterium]
MIFKSPHPDVEIPNVPIQDYVLRHAQRLADKPALVDAASGRTITYGQLSAGVGKVAAGLTARGFHKGDVFAIYSPNVPEYAMVFLAVTSVGGTNTTINPLYTVEELANQLKDSKARFLVTVPPFLDKAKEAAARSGVEEVFVVGEAEGATPFSALMTGPASAPPVAIDPGEDLAVLPYSSGTTGLPKGVMLTHRNLVANLCQCEGMESFNRLKESDVILAVLPFFHIYGMVVIMQWALAVGATLIVMPRFDMEEFLGSVQKYGITKAPLVPPIVVGLAKHPAVDKYDLSSLSFIFSGAAPLGEAVAREAAQRVDCTLAQGYGMTEASPVTHLSPCTRSDFKVGASGMPVPNTEVKLVDPATDGELGRNESGELWIRGPQIMKGYLGQPEATAESIDPEGWYKTGDVGFVDDEGYFFIVDRVKELIKYKAMQVAPAELEALILTHPAVADAAVVPSPDEEAGEIPKAFVVLKPSHQATAEELMGFVAKHVAPHKRIRMVEFIEQVPKSASGKILRRVLVEQERQRVAG